MRTSVRGAGDLLELLSLSFEGGACLVGCCLRQLDAACLTFSCALQEFILPLRNLRRHRWTDHILGWAVGWASAKTSWMASR